MALATVSAKRDNPRHKRRLSPLTRRIMAINSLALLLLLLAVLYLSRYEASFIRTELDKLETEALIFAASLGEGAVELDDNEVAKLQNAEARIIVRRLVEATDTRTRLFALDGRVVADSRKLMGPGGLIEIETLPEPNAYPQWVRNLSRQWYRLIDWLPGRGYWPDYVEKRRVRGKNFPDVVAALSGEVGRQLWNTQDQGMVMTVAVPVTRYKQVLGVVQVVRAGDEVEKTIRSVRMDILRIFIFTLSLTLLMSYYLARAIARPIHLLSIAADRVRFSKQRVTEIPNLGHRGDEIGDLSQALRDMTDALAQKLDAIERFAADVAHELKNPLTSMRSAVETLEKVNNPEKQKKLVAIILDDCQRLDRLITDIASASRLDAELSRAALTAQALGPLLSSIADHYTVRAERGEASVQLQLPSEPVYARLVTGRFSQVLQNLLDNALSFSPATAPVQMILTASENRAIIKVIDSGPGIPPQKLEAVFDRFYSERPKTEKFGQHSGLGLSIARQIIEAHGGRIYAANNLDADGQIIGAIFTVELPLAENV